MKITVNINMVDLKPENLKVVENFLKCIERYQARVILNIASLPASAGKLKNDSFPDFPVSEPS